MNFILTNNIHRKKKVMQDSPVTEGKAAVRGERRRAMEDKKEKNSQLEDLMAERERKKNKEKKVCILESFN